MAFIRLNPDQVQQQIDSGTLAPIRPDQLKAAEEFMKEQGRLGVRYPASRFYLAATDQTVYAGAPTSYSE